MIKNLLTKKVVGAVALALSCPIALTAFTAGAPSQLDTDVNGMVVRLTWNWGGNARSVMTEGFEGEQFPAEGWSVVNTYSYDEYGNWMAYTFEDEDSSLAHGGSRAAVLQFGEGDEDDPATSHQDEWLIVHPAEGSVYMDFWYYLYPELLEVGGYEDFPDHYYVKISRDNGDSWDELWDGRWDMGYVDEVQRASLFLGEETDEDTLVAFQAVSGEEESLYFLWCVDDVEFFAADDSETRKMTARKIEAGNRMRQTISGMATYRTFVPAPGAVKMPAKASFDDNWLNGGNTTFRIYRNGEIISDYLKARHFTDYDYKDAGDYVYEVMAWSESLDEEYAAAEAEVEIGEVEFGAARNVTAGYEEQENGKYVIMVAWEAPEGDMHPDHYVVYVNGKQMGWIDSHDELAAGQSGIYKGVYTFAVEACYVHPEGTAERVCATVCPGTVFPPAGLKLSEEGNDVTLTWSQPEGEETPTAYSVYRGDTLLASGLKETSYTDNDTPAGSYYYNVHAEYEDGEVSLPASVAYYKEGCEAYPVPFAESFSHGHLPSGWEVSLVDPLNTVKDMYAWRFDNWFGESIPFEGFASVTGLASGMNKLQTYLDTPVMELPADGEYEVSFDKYFYEEKPGMSGPAQFILYITTDGGDVWTEFADLRETENDAFTISLTEYAGKRIRLRWGFLGRMSGIAAIDNLYVGEKGGSGIPSALPGSEEVAIYTLSGIKIGEGRQSLPTLPSGIYLLRTSDGKTSKYTRK